MAPKPGPCADVCNQDDKNWFVLLRGKRYGPLYLCGTGACADRGVVDPEAGVWCLGWDEWRIARNVPGLFKPDRSQAGTRPTS